MDLPAKPSIRRWESTTGCFFRETDDFATAFRALVTALDTDLDHVKFHTRLLVKARDWETKGKTEDLLTARAGSKR